MFRPLTWTALCALTLMFAVAATAGTWGGHNGDIRLSFTEGPEYTHVKEQEALPKAGVILDLYAYLCDVDPVVYRNERYLSVGGWELQLAVDGCEWEILQTEVPERTINAGVAKGVVYAGKYAGVTFKDGDAKLIRWRLRLHGEPEQVVFRLEPAGLNSCQLTPDCPEHAPAALWTGSGAAGQVGIMFGAGYVPAYLNWGEEAPEIAPVRGTGSWRDTGLFTLDDDE